MCWKSCSCHDWISMLQLALSFTLLVAKSHAFSPSFRNVAPISFLTPDVTDWIGFFVPGIRNMTWNGLIYEHIEVDAVVQCLMYVPMRSMRRIQLYVRRPTCVRTESTDCEHRKLESGRGNETIPRTVVLITKPPNTSWPNVFARVKLQLKLWKITSRHCLIKTVN